MAGIILTLPDMHCGGCVSAVTRVVQRLDPVARVTADLTARTVAIATALDDTALRAALRQAGFPPA